jgi:transcription elongation factor Elf1
MKVYPLNDVIVEDLLDKVQYRLKDADKEKKKHFIRLLISKLLGVDLETFDKDTCPNCGSNDITSDLFDNVSQYQPVTCNSCNERWDENYLFTGITKKV